MNLISVQTTKFVPAKGSLVKVGWLGIAETGGFPAAVRFRRYFSVTRNTLPHNPSEPPMGGPPQHKALPTVAFNKGGSGYCRTSAYQGSFFTFTLPCPSLSAFGGHLSPAGRGKGATLSFRWWRQTVG